MANLLQSTQQTATTAPQFYTDYLSNIASRGQQAQQAAQYVGAQPLQQQAFQTAGQNVGAFQPAISTGEQLVQQAAGQDIAGAAAPYLAAGTAVSPLAAMAPFAANIAAISPADLASQYMNPFIGSAVQSMSDVARRNIQETLAPQATAAAVGSGQFGSQRGAQVLGQVQRQAEQDLNNQIAQMLTSGYGQALTAAGQRQQLLGQLGSTASSAQQAYNQALLDAAKTSGGLTAQQAQALQQAGLGMGTLGTQAQGMSLADINALATLGGQQQQIAQGAQMFPLTSLSSLANLLQGAQVPTTVTSQLNMSPLSVLAGAGAGIGGLLQPYSTNVPVGSGQPQNVLQSIQQLLGMKVNQPTGQTSSSPISSAAVTPEEADLAQFGIVPSPTIPDQSNVITYPYEDVGYPQENILP
jgi:hypothetical protein